jgi:EAL domain-containing protein (putative c-di-GMP-specific phosphodiesterase class I)/CheY-like chemotaxis protein
MVRHPALRALIVDDDAVVLATLQRILTKNGYEVAVARDGEEGWVLASSVNFDVVVTDLEMPKSGGIELFNSIRQSKPELPFVFVTGKPTLESAVEVMNKGATAYLPKPFQPQQILDAVSRATKGNRPAVSILPPPDESADRFAAALDKLHLHYQPIVRWSTQTAYSYEALMRTRCAEVPHPGAFLDLAEALGQVHELGRSVRARAAYDLETMEGAPGTIFVNLHPEELLDDHLYDSASELSRVAGRVYLEITERESLRGISDIMDRIHALKALGYRIAIDDIGAGYSGLNSFVDWEPDLVKIDMGLIRGIDTCNRRTKLVSTLLDLARELEIDVVAEGVETEGERDALVELKCDLLQGYLFSKPAEPFPSPVFPR